MLGKECQIGLAALVGTVKLAVASAVKSLTIKLKTLEKVYYNCKGKMNYSRYINSLSAARKASPIREMSICISYYLLSSIKLI